MAVHNGASTLPQAMESILSQEGVDFELIAVDDGSTDGSSRILSEYAGRDSRIRLIRQENEGLTRALIRGCDNAHGRYIARQDADDVSLPDRLRRQCELLEAQAGVVLASCWCNYIGPHGERLTTVKRPADSEEATRRLLHEREGPPAHGTVMFRRDTYERVGGYREEFYYGQDSDLWLRMGLHGRIAYVPEVLYEWLYSPDGISAAHRDLQKRFGELGQACHKARVQGKSDAPILVAVRELRERVTDPHGRRRGHRQRAAAGYYFIASSLEGHDKRAAVRYFWKAVSAYPLHLRGWVRLFLACARVWLAGRGARP